jgi:ribonuclease BN (tRNA processing enzyme)
VRITVLGKSPAWADAGGACSGYLVESGGACLLLDCGPGVFGKLRAVRDYARVDAVVLSDLHADHMLDVIPYASALRYGPRWLQGSSPRPALIAPTGAAEAFARVCAGSGMREEHVPTAFALREYEPAERVDAGPFRLRFQPLPHYVPTNAVEVADGGARLTFSGDCGPNDRLSGFAEGTDLLLVEATETEEEAAEEGADRGHLTPREAGEHGRRARARRVVLTHISDELDLVAARDQAAAAYGGPVDVAAEGAVYDI